jgi:hypothetical protein
MRTRLLVLVCVLAPSPLDWRPQVADVALCCLIITAGVVLVYAFVWLGVRCATLRPICSHVRRGLAFAGVSIVPLFIVMVTVQATHCVLHDIGSDGVARRPSILDGRTEVNA